MMWKRTVAIACTVGAMFGAMALGESQRANLALGRRVQFAPAPNYRLTKAGGTDELDLTDGKLTVRRDAKMWFDKRCVGFLYPGLVQLEVDLGAVQPIGEVAARFQGGSPQAGISFPGWVDLVMSVDGRRYYRVASYSKWRPGDKAKYGVPPNEGKAWIHTLRFRRLNVAARYVGLSFYGTAVNVLDEIYVFRSTSQRKPKSVESFPVASFTTRGALVYVHKPNLMLTTNISTPNPLGLIVGPEAQDKPCVFTIDLPSGLRFVGGSLGGVELATLKPKPVEGGRFSRYTIAFQAKGTKKCWGFMYIGGNWRPGQRGAIRLSTRWPGGATPLIECPLEAISVPRTPQPRRLMIGLGWWSLPATMKWPNALQAFRTLGFNTVPVFAYWTKPDDREAAAFLEKCRAEGFKILNIDSTFHRMLSRHRQAKEFYCQFGNGKVGKKLCPSYRGPFYREEIERLARECARVKANYVSLDIELWGWRGPTDCEKCTRCRRDFERSGAKSWEEWRLKKGEEMWRDLSDAIRREMAKVGLPMPDLGGYDFRPGHNYQQFWPFDRLYPRYMSCSQVSTYTPLEPYHLMLIGDEVRADRERLPRSDVMPWITPGDAGTFPGEKFRLALLECFCNGARGVYFWSPRVWDAESMAAFAHAVRNVAPVEDVIVEGELLKGVRTRPTVRVSGMRRGDRMIALVADYRSTRPKRVRVEFPVKVVSEVVDLDTGRRLGTVGPASREIEIEIPAGSASILYVRPRVR